MKKFIIVFVSICCLVFATFATAAVITINLDSVPTDLECDTECLCDQNWVVSNVVLYVTSTTSAEGCTTNDCDWEHGNNLYGPVFDPGILLKPGRLVLDLSGINDPITQIRVDLEDYCPTTGCSSAAIYDGATRVALKTSQSDNGPIDSAGWFIFDQALIGNYTIDKFIVTSCDGHIGEITITTTTTSPTATTCTPFGCGTTYSTCGIGCGTTYSTCGMGCGTTYSTCGIGCGTTYSTCGIGCGTTYSTCGISCGTTYSTCGISCGTTYSTCGISCGTTYSTCGIGCGTTYNTCGIGCGTTYSTCGIGCGTTYSTCGISCGTTYSTCGIGCGTTFNTCGIGCGTTFNTCGIGCGTTFNTCSLGCGYTSSWCQYPGLYGTGYSRYRASSDIPSPTLAY